MVSLSVQAVRLLSVLPPGLARLPAPSALAVYAAELLGRDPDRDRVRLGQNVVFWGIVQLALIFRAFCRCLLPFCYRMPPP